MWHFSVNGQTLGPISEADLDARIAAGSVPPNVYVWREDMEGWQPYDQVRSTAAAPAPAARPVLRVSVPVAASAAPVAEPQYANADALAGSSTDVQGSSRLESISSWGMIVVVGLAMFVFIGILASKPHDARAAGTEAVDDADSFDADVQLKGGSIVIENKSDFDWPATTFAFRSGVTRYSYRLDRLPRAGKSAIPLNDFSSTRGVKFSPASSPNPREVTIRVTGHGSATARL